MERYEQLYNLLQEVLTDFRKFYEQDNNAAGTRVRLAMQQLKKLAQEVRVDVSEKKNG